MILLNSGPGNYITGNGRKYSYFGGNNYLGLAGHPEVKEAAIAAIAKYGVNFAASRRTSGTSTIHLELEEALSQFKGKDDTVVFASGYLGNTILLEALSGKFTAVFADKFAHSSIRSAVSCSGCEVYFYDHCNADDLDFLLSKHKSLSPLIITDGVFALTGEIAPAGSIFKVASQHNAILVIDDAHATGVLGEKGSGTPEHFGIHENNTVFQTETMSKAVGSYGGFISCSHELAELIRDRSVAYQASTSLSSAVVAAGIAAVRIIREHPGLRNMLMNKAAYLRNEIRRIGFTSTETITPIIPLIFNDRETAVRLNGWLEEKGIIVPFMNYPSENEMFILRLAVTAIHEERQIDELLDRLGGWKSSH
jgi:7-keto-8-aminopelargonate synthetase-like enzyme